MRPEQRTKSRTKLYNALYGSQEITGAGGRLAVGSIQFANIPTAGETVTIGGYVFEAQAGASEAAGTSAGTAADPHLFQSITNLATAGASLAAKVLEETATTGAWGYLYPDDSVGCVFATDTLTLTFWPGTWANSVTLAGSAGDETIVQPVTASLGRNTTANIDISKRVNVIDTTGSTQTKEYYVIPDGEVIGDTTSILIKTAETTDTPTIVGKLQEGEAAHVEALFTDAAGGKYLELMWDGSRWINIDENGEITFTAAS
jgi:hypothetical protein